MVIIRFIPKSGVFLEFPMLIVKITLTIIKVIQISFTKPLFKTPYFMNGEYDVKYERIECLIYKIARLSLVNIALANYSMERAMN